MSLLERAAFHLGRAVEAVRLMVEPIPPRRGLPIIRVRYTSGVVMIDDDFLVRVNVVP